MRLDNEDILRMSFPEGYALVKEWEMVSPGDLVSCSMKIPNTSVVVVMTQMSDGITGTPVSDQLERFVYNIRKQNFTSLSFKDLSEKYTNALNNIGDDCRRDIADIQIEFFNDPHKLREETPREQVRNIRSGISLS